MFATDLREWTRYTSRMISTWLLEAMTHKGWNQSELARRLTEKYPAWSNDRSKIYKATKEKRKLSAEELYQIADVTGYSIPDSVISLAGPNPETSLANALEETRSAAMARPKNTSPTDRVRGRAAILALISRIDGLTPRNIDIIMSTIMTQLETNQSTKSSQSDADDQPSTSTPHRESSSSRRQS